MESKSVQLLIAPCYW